MAPATGAMDSTDGGGAGVGADPRTATTGELMSEISRFVRMLKAHANSQSVLDDKASLMLLMPLMYEGPKRLRELAAAKGVDQSTASRQADHLVKAGLVRRDPDPDDRRARLIVLTDRGRSVCQEMAEARHTAVARALDGWDIGRIAEFVSMFRDFNQAVERYGANDPTAGPTAHTEPRRHQTDNHSTRQENS